MSSSISILGRLPSMEAAVMLATVGDTMNLTVVDSFEDAIEEDMVEITPRYADLRQVVGRALKVLRLGRGYTQADLAKLLAAYEGKPIDQAIISRIERCQKGVTIGRLGHILDCLDRTFADLDVAIRELAKADAMSPDRRCEELKKLAKQRLGSDH